MDKRAKIIEHITPLNDGHGHSLQEKIDTLDYILKGENSYSDMRHSAMEIIRCNQGRSITKSELILWLIDIVERWE